MVRVLRADTMMRAVHDEAHSAIDTFYPSRDDPRPQQNELTAPEPGTGGDRATHRRSDPSAPGRPVRPVSAGGPPPARPKPSAAVAGSPPTTARGRPRPGRRPARCPRARPGARPARP